jgi:NDP-sugar pyrophosphorylase family protein
MPLGLQPGTNGPGVKGVPSSAIIPPVFVGRNVRVAPDAKIGPYTVLGDDCEVGSGATVADSLLWDGVVVEAGASLDWAIVASRARIGAGAVVGRGSVIGHGAVIASNAAVGENARIPAPA